MVSHRHNQHAFANLRHARSRCSGVRLLCPATRDKRRNHDGRHRPHRYPASWFEPHAPATPGSFRKPRCDLLPHRASILQASLGNGEIVKRTEHSLNAFELGAAGSAARQMLGNGFALRSFPLSISDQLFFCQVFHSYVPLGSGAAPAAFACSAPRAPTYGSKARRNFCTDRKTVFLAALVVDFSTAAISSIAQPSQWRITNAVRSEELSSFSASSIFFLSSVLPASRSGVGLSSATKSKGSCSCSSANALGVWRRVSSVRFWRMRSIA